MPLTLPLALAQKHRRAYLPSSIGMWVLEVLGVKDNVMYVKGMDMLGGTPVLDTKPSILDKHDCPSFVAKDDPQLRNPRE